MLIEIFYETFLAPGQRVSGCRESASESSPSGIPQNQSSVSNPARTNNVADRKHGSRCDYLAVRCHKSLSSVHILRPSWRLIEPLAPCQTAFCPNTRWPWITFGHNSITSTDSLNCPEFDRRSTGAELNRFLPPSVCVNHSVAVASLPIDIFAQRSSQIQRSEPGLLLH